MYSSISDLEHIRELRPNLLQLFLAMLDGKPIAGLMLFLLQVRYPTGKYR